jgi:GPH family glycoside/pentoside/hexuronide:cation symporter
MKTSISLLSLPVWTWLVKRSSKRFVWWVAAAIFCVGVLALYLLPATNIKVILTTLGVISFAYGAFTLNFWGMLPDTIEYSQLKTGVRADSVIFGLAQFVLKASIGIGAGALGFMLAFVGYEANVDQAADTLAGMRIVLCLIPIILQVCACLVLLAYPINNRSHAEMVRQIETR